MKRRITTLTLRVFTPHTTGTSEIAHHTNKILNVGKAEVGRMEDLEKWSFDRVAVASAEIIDVEE